MLVRWLIAVTLLSLPFYPWPSLAQQKEATASKIDLQGLKKILTENKGKVVLLNFFSPYWATCGKEVPFLIQLYNAHKNEGLEIIGISIGASPQTVGLFVMQKGINYPVFTAQDDIIEAYGVDSVPINIFISRDGKERGKEKDYDEEKKYQIEKEIMKLLEEKGR